MILFYFRIVTYTESTKPIIDHYDGLGLVRKVSASGTPETVCSLNVFGCIQNAKTTLYQNPLCIDQHFVLSVGLYFVLI